MNANSVASTMKAGAAPSHQRRGNQPASAITITSARQMNRNSAPSANQFTKSASR